MDARSNGRLPYPFGHENQGLVNNMAPFAKIEKCILSFEKRTLYEWVLDESAIFYFHNLTSNFHLACVILGVH